MAENNLVKRVENIERRLYMLEELFEKKRRDDNDLLSNLDESNFCEDFLKKIFNGGGTV